MRTHLPLLSDQSIELIRHDPDQWIAEILKDAILNAATVGPVDTRFVNVLATFDAEFGTKHGLALIDSMQTQVDQSMAAQELAVSSYKNVSDALRTGSPDLAAEFNRREAQREQQEAQREQQEAQRKQHEAQRKQQEARSRESRERYNQDAARRRTTRSQIGRRDR